MPALDIVVCLLPSSPRGCCYRSETHLKLKSRDISFSHNLVRRCFIFLKFARSTTVSLQCSVVNFKTIGWMTWMLWKNEIWGEDEFRTYHYNDGIMSVMSYLITSLTSVYSSVYSGADQRNHQSSTSLAFVRGIHRWPVNFPHKGPVTRKTFPFDDVIMIYYIAISFLLFSQSRCSAWWNSVRRL